MRIRAASIDELKPKPKVRALSPRQIAAQKREEEVRKAFGKLKGDELLALELEGNEAITLWRAAAKRAIAAHRPDVNMAVRGRTIYLSTAKLPNRGRPRKAG
jgi:hypothetical protein